MLRCGVTERKGKDSEGKEKGKGVPTSVQSQHIKTSLNEKSVTAQILRFLLILLNQLYHHRPEGRGEKGVGSDGRREGGRGAGERMVREGWACVWFVWGGGTDVCLE